jgi:hypothetical protein
MNRCDGSSWTSTVMSNGVSGAVIVGAFQTISNSLSVGLRALKYVWHFHFLSSVAVAVSLLRLPPKRTSCASSAVIDIFTPGLTLLGPTLNRRWSFRLRLNGFGLELRVHTLSFVWDRHRSHSLFLRSEWIVLRNFFGPIHHTLLFTGISKSSAPLFRQRGQRCVQPSSSRLIRQPLDLSSSSANQKSRGGNSALRLQWSHRQTKASSYSSKDTSCLLSH